jgi:hypothetical protein
MSATFKIIPLYPNGQSSVTVDLEGAVTTFVTKYNYSAACWVLDLYDQDGNLLLAGLMLIPATDILKPYPEQQKTLGSMVLIEHDAGNYTSPDLLGVETALLWFAPGTEVELPV